MAFGSKNKGSTFERAIADWFSEAGYPARRVPLSGAAQDYPGDVSVDWRGGELLIEAKAVESSYLALHRATEANEINVLYDTGITLLAITPDQMLKLLDGSFEAPVNYPWAKTSLKTISAAMRGAHIFVSKHNRKPWAFGVFLNDLDRFNETEQRRLENEQRQR